MLGLKADSGSVILGFGGFTGLLWASRYILPIFTSCVENPSAQNNGNKPKKVCQKETKENASNDRTELYWVNFDQ